MSGPTFCDVCGSWQASIYAQGKRCNLCELRDYARKHPLPLPSDPRMRADLLRLTGESGKAGGG